MLRFFVGVHRRVPAHLPAPGVIPWGHLIHGLTVARWGNAGKPPFGGWSFPDGPATHAFVVYQVSPDVTPMRVDAEFPVATEDTFDLHRFPPHTRLWEVMQGDKAAAIQNAALYPGKKYDMGQAVAQLMGPVVPSLLMPLVPFQGLQGGARGDICTEAACRATGLCGGFAKTLTDEVMVNDHLPEELAMALRTADGNGWFKEFVP